MYSASRTRRRRRRRAPPRPHRPPSIFAAPPRASLPWKSAPAPWTPHAPRRDHAINIYLPPTSLFAHLAPPRLAAPTPGSRLGFRHRPVAGLFDPESRLTPPPIAAAPAAPLGATSPGSLSLSSRRVGLICRCGYDSGFSEPPGSSEFRVGRGCARNHGCRSDSLADGRCFGSYRHSARTSDASLPSGGPIFAGRPVTGVRCSFASFALGQKGCAGRSGQSASVGGPNTANIRSSWLLSYMSRLFSSTPRNSGERVRSSPRIAPTAQMSTATR